MFFMSFWDSLSSLATALTTLPMPKDVIYDYSYGSFGNSQTCSIQAFTILFGTGLVLFSNILLNIYYLCTIRYSVSEAKFRKYAEFIFLLVTTPLSLAQPIYFANTDTLNPTPYDAYCLIGVYPYECLSNDDIECLRGDKDTFDLHQYVISISVLAQVIILIVTMLFILHTTWFSQHDESSNVKTIAIQAFMYLVACLLTWVPAAIFSMVPDNKAVDAFSTFFFPMQGFFNLLIFAYHKVYAYKTFNSFLLTTDIIKLLFTHPEKFKHQYVTGIENVERMHQTRNMEGMFQQNELSAPEIFHDDSGSTKRLPNGTRSSNGDQEMVVSVELSVQPSSAKDIDSFLERNHDLSLG